MHTIYLRVGPAPADVRTFGLTAYGLTVPTREQIEAHVEHTMRDVLGTDADLSPGSEWGAVAAHHVPTGTGNVVVVARELAVCDATKIEVNRV